MMNNMRTIIIIPTSGDIEAPGIAVNVSKNDKIADAYVKAIKEAKSRSRLSDFDNWVFI